MQLALGTVQFGLAYGVAGRQAPVSEADAARILAYAHERGVRRLDTAPGYGDIEGRLLKLCEGRSFEIVSKIPTLPVGLDVTEACAFVEQSIETSRAALGEGLVGVIFHDEQALADQRGTSIWVSAVRAARRAGLRIGVSRYGPGPGDRSDGGSSIEMVQLPGNALDQRIAAWSPLGCKPEVSLRSAYLQGLLLLTPEQAMARVPLAAEALGRWRSWCAAHGLSPARAALSIVKGFAQVDYCLVGVDSVEQIADTIDEWDAAVATDAPELACTDPAVIDPRQWGGKA